MPPLGMDWGLPRQEPIRASVRSNDAMLQLECAACQEQYYSLMVIAACGVPELTDQLSLGVKSILSVDHWSIHPFFAQRQHVLLVSACQSRSIYSGSWNSYRN